VLSNQAFAVASELLRKDDFYILQHQHIFAAMLDLDREGIPIDYVTLTERLTTRGTLEVAGGVEYVSKLGDGLPKTTNVMHYSKIVKEKAGMRALAFSAESLAAQAIDKTETLATVLERAETVIAGIRESSENQEKAPVSIQSALKESWPQFERLAEGKFEIIGEQTGYPALDKVTAGWCSEDLVIVGARPSMGKTALCMEFARRMAQKKNPVLIFSLEMSRASLLLRLACTVARVDSQKLRVGECDSNDLAKLTRAFTKMGEWPLWIADSPRLYSYELVPKVRHYAERYKLKLVIVDYLQLVRAKAENRTQEVSEVSRDLKEAAKALGKVSGGTLIATAQLSRAAKRQPTLQDLRESGQIEQDADVVMFLWNRNAKDRIGQADPIDKWLGVAKQRNGPIKNIALTFAPQFTAFEQADFEEQDPFEEGQ
jgi:replicative DNA helicase